MQKHGPGQNVAVIESWHTEPSHRTNPYGQVKTAWIKVCGPLVPVDDNGIKAQEEVIKGTKNQQKSTFPGMCCPRCQRERGPESENEAPGSILRLDCPQKDRPEMLRHWNAHVLILRHIFADDGWEGYRDGIWGLVVKQVA